MATKEPKGNAKRVKIFGTIILILIIGLLLVQFLALRTQHKHFESTQTNTQLLTILTKSQEQLIIQNEILALEIAKLDSIIQLESLNQKELVTLKETSQRQNQKLSADIDELNSYLVQTDTISRNQFYSLQNEINYNRKRLIRSSEPKLAIEGINGQVIGSEGNWSVRYSFSIKNYGGDIQNLKLEFMNDTVPRLQFPVPGNQKLPHLGAISVNLTSKTLSQPYHEAYLLMKDDFGNNFRQRVYFSQNTNGFRFDLGFMEKVN